MVAPLVAVVNDHVPLRNVAIIFGVAGCLAALVVGWNMMARGDVEPVDIAGAGRVFIVAAVVVAVLLVRLR